MSLIRQTLSRLGPAVGGAVAALAVLVVFPDHRDAPQHHTQPSPSADDAQLAPSVADLNASVVRRNSRRLVELEARLDEMPDSDEADLTGDDAPSGDDAPIDQPPPDIEEMRERLFAQWDDKLSRHDHENVDTEWSAQVTPRFQADLETIASDGEFKTLEVKCMSHTCSATLEYDSFQSAAAGYTSLVHHRYQENCAKEIVLPEPEDPSLPYVATVLYDCSKAKEQRVATAR